MSNRTLLAAELARRIPDLQADALVNNEALIKGMIEQYLGPEIRTDGNVGWASTVYHNPPADPERDRLEKLFTLMGDRILFNRFGAKEPEWLTQAISELRLSHESGLS